MCRSLLCDIVYVCIATYLQYKVCSRMHIYSCIYGPDRSCCTGAVPYGISTRCMQDKHLSQTKKARPAHCVELSKLLTFHCIAPGVGLRNDVHCCVRSATLGTRSVDELVLVDIVLTKICAADISVLSGALSDSKRLTTQWNSRR